MINKFEAEAILRQCLSMPIQPQRISEAQASADNALLDDIFNESPDAPAKGLAFAFLSARFPQADADALWHEVEAAARRVDDNNPVFVLADKPAVVQFAHRAWGYTVVTLGEMDLRALLHGDFIGATVQDTDACLVHLDDSAKAFAASLWALTDHNHVVL